VDEIARPRCQEPFFKKVHFAKGLCQRWVLQGPISPYSFMANYYFPVEK
jgi:hypothetical protein